MQCQGIFVIDEGMIQGLRRINSLMNEQHGTLDGDLHTLKDG